MTYLMKIDDVGLQRELDSDDQLNSPVDTSVDFIPQMPKERSSVHVRGILSLHARTHIYTQ